MGQPAAKHDVTQARWEFGSMLHLAPYAPGQVRGIPPWERHPHCLVSSGRDALRLAARAGGYARVWISSYACQDLVPALTRDGVQVLRYADDPTTAVPQLEASRLRRGDAVIVTNYFGLRAPCRPSLPDGVDVIEDHTHAPGSRWAHRSAAAYCVASLRKLWPLPDGGVLWSPCGARLETCDRVAPHMAHALSVRMTGMLHRQLYLQGHAVDKAHYRECLREGEHLLVDQQLSAITPLSRGLLQSFPLQAWRELRARHFAHVRAEFPARDYVRLLEPWQAEDVPFAAMLLFDEESQWARAREALAQRNIYASQLWPQDVDDAEGIRPFDRQLSRRLCALPLDMRYGSADLERVLAHLHEVL